MAQNEQEASLLAAFRAKLTDTDEKVDDYCLLRFLRARSLDVDKAYAQFLGWQKWSRSIDLPNILTKPFPKFANIARVVSGKTVGVTKGGFPLVQRRIGEVNAQAALALINPSDMELYHVVLRARLQERMRELSEKSGKHIDRLVAIIDLKGLSLQALRAVSLFKIASGLDSQYYPETVEMAFVVNAPGVFPTCWKAVSAFIDPKTKTKIHILSASEQTATLLKYIDADQLPKEYGGTNEEHAPHAEPQKVLEELKLKEEQLAEELTFTTVTVAAKDSTQVSYPVGEGGLVGWYVKLDSKDIDFSVEFVYDKQGAGILAVVPQVRCSNHEGSFAAEGPGTMYVNFNNKFSLLTSKSVRYNISVGNVLQ